MSLRIEALSHSYPTGVLALSGLDLEFAPGITGVLGRNGAGKSTLIRILATLLRPSRGRVRWNGVDTWAHPEGLRSVLGYLPQDFSGFPQLSTLEFLQYVGAHKRLKSTAVRVQALGLLERLHLEPGRLLSGLSGGMRQRLGIAQALLGRPELLILDEPSVGLDAEERLNLSQMLMELPGAPTVLLCTHLIGDLEGRVDRLLLLASGQVGFYGTPAHLLETAQGQVWTWTQAAHDAPWSGEGLHSATRSGGGLEQRCIQPQRPHPAAQRATPTLEDAVQLCTQRGTISVAEVRHA